jgi:hypothetical protein
MADKSMSIIRGLTVVGQKADSKCHEKVSGKGSVEA